MAWAMLLGCLKLFLLFKRIGSGVQTIGGHQAPSEVFGWETPLFAAMNCPGKERS